MKYPNSVNASSLAAPLFQIVVRIRIFKKVIFGMSVIGLTLLLGQVEYDDFKLFLIIDPLKWIIIPIAIWYVLPFKKTFSNFDFILIGISAISSLTVYLLFTDLFCKWSQDSYLYKSKKDRSLFIVCRRYDCLGLLKIADFMK